MMEILQAFKDAAVHAFDTARDAAPLVAYLSLGIALFTLWLTRLRPFILDANFGPLFLIPKVDPASKQVQLMIGLPITLYNRGAMAGFVEDLAIKMEGPAPDQSAAMFFPLMFYDSHQWLLSKLKSEPEALALRETFAGIYLPPKELYSKEILFGMRPTKRQFEMKPGDYVFTIFIKLQGKKFKTVERRVEKITQEALNNFLSETMTVTLTFPERANLQEKELPP